MLYSIEAVFIQLHVYKHGWSYMDYFLNISWHFFFWIALLKKN